MPKRFERILIAVLLLAWWRSARRSLLAEKTVVYKNKRHRFRFSLLGSWKGCSILVDENPKGLLVVSPAGVGPSELGRNGKYVFALPARCTYAERTGCGEVGTVAQADPQHAY